MAGLKTGSQHRYLAVCVETKAAGLVALHTFQT